MLLERFLEQADQHADKLAAADPLRRLTYHQLTTFAQVMRGVIRRHSRCPRIGLMLPGSTAFAGTLLGCWWADREAVSLNFLLQTAELQAIVADAGLDLIITIKYFAEQAAALGVPILYLEDAGLKGRYLLAKFLPQPRVPELPPERTAVILYTSGTSGLPKGVELTHGNLFSNCRDSISHAQIQSDHVLLSVLPPFHIFGLTALTLLPLYMGMTTHFLPRFSPAETIKTLRQERISILMAIPSMYAAIGRLKNATAEDFKSIFLAVSGGEPLPTGTSQHFLEKYQLQLNEGYGLTETSPVISINLPWSRAEGAVGRIIPNSEVRIVDHEGQFLPAGQDGEIQFRGPGVMKGYYHKPEETAAVYTTDGWFKTGDQGRLDSQGFLSITGRIKEMMIVGGENVFPREIENVLVQHPAVSEAAVIGQRDPSRGEVPIAYVILKDGHQCTDSDLRSFCRDRLASFKVPREITISTDLPRSPTGKILKRALK
ncbi:MAG: Long-chain-fatty-acid--CoA ligase [Phycisphaerae bacterium]|nr:Long-chain-fatty-acid--CoA ligase [Phycisphaerae bacterium]